MSCDDLRQYMQADLKEIIQCQKSNAIYVKSEQLTKHEFWRFASIYVHTVCQINYPVLRNYFFLKLMLNLIISSGYVGHSAQNDEPELTKSDIDF
jgi:hypothetical protein